MQWDSGLFWMGSGVCASGFWGVGICIVWYGDFGICFFDGDYSCGEDTGGEVADAGRVGEFRQFGEGGGPQCAIGL